MSSAEHVLPGLPIRANSKHLSASIRDIMREELRITSTARRLPRLLHPNSRWRIDIHPNYKGAFSPELLRSYDTFVNTPGTLLKEEERTTIKHFGDASESNYVGSPSFVIKHYLYPGHSLRWAWHIWSKAHREFAALEYCRRLGVPAVEPVACGVERTRLGSVKSCFLVTRYMPHCITLRDYLDKHADLSPGEKRGLEAFMRQLGSFIRTIHARHFYLSRLSAKNILLQYTEKNNFEWFLLDQPYARRLYPLTAVRSGQLRDLGALEASITRYGIDVFEHFYSGYLPDPLGADETELRRRVAHGRHIHQNRTLPRRIFKMGNRRMKAWIRKAVNP